MTQTDINKRPRLQKLQGKFKIKETVKTANTTIGKTLKHKDLILTEINHLTYATAMVITEVVNGTGCYKSETLSPKTPPWVRLIQENINGIREDLSALAEIKVLKWRHRIQKGRLIKKYKIEKEENLDEATEELKQKVS